MVEDSLSEQVKEVYANFGLAIYQAQCLEHGIANALVYIDLVPNRRRLAKDADEWAALVDSFMSSNFELTLGQMIRRLKEVTTVAPELEGQLSAALARRNWLAHHYFRERSETFLTSAGRATMLVELEAAQEVISRADVSLEATIKPAREKLGFTDELLEATYAELRAQVGE